MGQQHPAPTDALVGTGIALGLLVPVLGLPLGLVLLRRPGSAGVQVCLLSVVGVLAWALVLTRA